MPLQRHIRAGAERFFDQLEKSNGYTLLGDSQLAEGAMRSAKEMIEAPADREGYNRFRPGVRRYYCCFAPRCPHEKRN